MVYRRLWGSEALGSPSLELRALVCYTTRTLGIDWWRNISSFPVSCLSIPYSAFYRGLSVSTVEGEVYRVPKNQNQKKQTRTMTLNHNYPY